MLAHWKNVARTNEIVHGSSYTCVVCKPCVWGYLRTDEIVKIDMKSFGMLHDRVMAILTASCKMTMKTVPSGATRSI
jgi:hypothetical protein